MADSLAYTMQHIPPTYVYNTTPFPYQLAEHVHKVIADGAAEAAVVEHHNLLLALAALADQVLLDAHEIAVHIHLPKLVLNHGQAVAMIGLEQVVEQRRLAAAQPARDDLM